LPLIPLPRPYGSHEFEVAYYAALNGKPLEIGISRTLPQSMNALTALYYSSAEFKGLRPSTARVDIVRLGWRHVIKGKIAVKQNKTGAEVTIQLFKSFMPRSIIVRATV
jgi:hypothetical protein